MFHNMPVTTDPNDPRLKNIEPSGMQEAYLVLSDEERQKGFIRPYRDVYRHVGIRPQYPIVDLTPEEHERYDKYGYVKFEKYPETGEGITNGRFWTQAQLESGCNGETRMGQALSETYARDPKFYGATFCSTCGKHFPVAEFIWVADGQVVGS